MALGGVRIDENGSVDGSRAEQQHRLVELHGAQLACRERAAEPEHEVDEGTGSEA